MFAMATAACGANETGSPSSQATSGGPSTTTTGGSAGATAVASTTGVSTSGAIGGMPSTTGNGGAPGTTGDTTTDAAANTTGAGGTMQAPLGSLDVTNLTIEANPRMTLGAYVSWTSSEPANSEVRFGQGGHEFRVVVDDMTTEHRVHVVGMHAETDYDIKAVSTSATATGSAEGAFTTGSLPSIIPAQGTLVAEEFERMQPGWTLSNIQVGANPQPSIAILVDELGLPVWYFIQGTQPDQQGTLTVDPLPNGSILVGNAGNEPAREVDLEGNILWEGPTGGDARLSHHTEKLSNGNYIVARESASSARIEELTPDNEVVWSWDLYDHIDSPGTNDYCHLNAATFDAAEEFMYFNCRYLGLYKSDRSTGELLWHMGAAMVDSNSGDITYLPDNSVRFNDSHDPEVHADGTILFYDNQGWEGHSSGEMNGNYHSRVVEYQVDQDNLTATLTWEFPGDFATDAWYTDNWQTQIWGDADRLENGNVLITAGIRGAGTSTRIFEVTRDGAVVWGLEWPENHGSYRSERIPALAEKLP